MTDSQDAPVESTNPNGVGPFTVREVALLGVWAVAFIVSFFPLGVPGTPSVWTSGLLWILTIGVPTAAVGLLVLRRFSPDGIRRVGSLGIDQFASVAFSVSAVVWLQSVWAAIALSIEIGGFPGGWVQWVELVLMLGGVVLTVVAPFLPVLGADFVDRPEVPAHRAARPVLPVSARPRRERAPREPKPAREPKAPKGPRRVRGAEQAPGWDGGTPQGGYDPVAGQGGYDSNAFPGAEGAAGRPDGSRDAQQGGDAGSPQAADPQSDPFAAFGADAQETGAYAPVDPSQAQPVVDPSPAPAQQAFWALAPVERDVVDHNGVPLFRIGPTAWALVIEDRGTAFVVRDEDGRTGYLLDVSGVMRG